jgi:hypothetical protein
MAHCSRWFSGTCSIAHAACTFSAVAGSQARVAVPQQAAPRFVGFWPRHVSVHRTMSECTSITPQAQPPKGAAHTAAPPAAGAAAATTEAAEHTSPASSSKRRRVDLPDEPSSHVSAEHDTSPPAAAFNGDSHAARVDTTAEQAGASAGPAGQTPYVVPFARPSLTTLHATCPPQHAHTALHV